MVNYAPRLTGITKVQKNVKRIEGRTEKIKKTGKLNPKLPWNNDTFSKIMLKHFLVIPSSAYNLIPPHILMQQLKEQGQNVKSSTHDDKKY